MAETDAPPRPARDLAGGPDYDADFFLWTQRQAELIPQGRFEPVDCPHVAEEIGDTGARDIRELGSRLEVLLRHLLKWEFQPSARSGRWRSTIRTQRGSVLRVLKQSPSLRRHVAEDVADGYARALANGADETGLPLTTCPPLCERATPRRELLARTA